MMVERPVAPLSRPTASTAGSPVVEPGLTTPSAPAPTATPTPISPWQAAHELACRRAETDRVKVLVDFLARPICAHGGLDPDPDIVTAYNLAVEAALHGLRRLAQATAV